jgi:hypothetical protein
MDRFNSATFCDCPKPGSGFPTFYVVVIFCIQCKTNNHLLTVIVNSSNQYQQHKQSPLNSDGQQFEPISTTQSITYHLNSLNTKNDHDIKRWKPRSWLGTDTKGCRVEPVHVILLIVLLILVRIVDHHC